MTIWNEFDWTDWDIREIADEFGSMHIYVTHLPSNLSVYDYSPVIRTTMIKKVIPRKGILGWFGMTKEVWITVPDQKYIASVRFSVALRLRLKIEEKIARMEEDTVKTKIDEGTL